VTETPGLNLGANNQPLVFDAARARTRHAEKPELAAAQRLRFLSEASRVLAESLDYEATLGTVARLAVPDIADWCVVDLLQEDRSLVRVAIAHKDPARQQLAEELQRHYPARVEAATGPGQVLRTGQTDYHVHVPDSFLAVSEPERLQLLRSLGLNSYLCAPLRARGRLLGTITLFTEVGRILTSDDVTTAEDLARRAATAIDNARLYEHAQRALRSRDEMLAIVSHDLRTPLSAIMMGAEIQLATAPPTECGRHMRQRAELFRRAARHMCRLISDLTDITQIEAGCLRVELHPYDPESLMREVVETVRPSGKKQGTRVVYETVGTLPPVECDRDRIVQALSNLVSNAINVGARTIKLRAEAHGAAVVFTVQDSGPGIREDDLPHVFDRYWRGQKAGYKGTGLGLPIVKGIIDAHGGRCHVSSKTGIGTTFSVSLPR
jgi:signal transduction histidine kinase